MIKRIAFFIAIVFVSCSTTKTITSTQSSKNNTTISSDSEGSSFEKAVMIKEKTETRGINAEYDWLANNYPGYRSLGQSLVFHDKQPFDIINIVTANGKKKSIYFNISNFYGKF